MTALISMVRHFPAPALSAILFLLAIEILSGKTFANEKIAGKGETMPQGSGPLPGDIFKEFTYHAGAKGKDPRDFPKGETPVHFAECDPESKNEYCIKQQKALPRELELDLDGAIRAEMCVSYWGGHIGTADQKFKINGNDWFNVPQPVNTPTPPQCYYRDVVGGRGVEIPLSQLKNGKNIFQFTCGKQIKYGFDWGFYWVYSFTVRIYYSESKPHPTGEILLPRPNTAISDSQPISVKALASPNSSIKQVDFIGFFHGHGIVVGSF